MIYTVLYLLFCTALVVGIISVVKHQGGDITVGDFLITICVCYIPLLNAAALWVVLDELGFFNIFNKKLF